VVCISECDKGINRAFFTRLSLSAEKSRVLRTLSILLYIPVFIWLSASPIYRAFYFIGEACTKGFPWFPRPTEMCWTSGLLTYFLPIETILCILLVIYFAKRMYKDVRSGRPLFILFISFILILFILIILFGVPLFFSFLIWTSTLLYAVGLLSRSESGEVSEHMMWLVGDRRALFILFIFFISTLFISTLLGGAPFFFFSLLIWASTLLYAVSLLSISESRKISEHMIWLVMILSLLLCGPYLPLGPWLLLAVPVVIFYIIPLYILIPDFFILNIASKIKYVRMHVSVLMFLLAFIPPVLFFSEFPLLPVYPSSCLFGIIHRIACDYNAVKALYAEFLRGGTESLYLLLILIVIWLTPLYGEGSDIPRDLKTRRILVLISLLLISPLLTSALTCPIH